MADTFVADPPTVAPSQIVTSAQFCDALSKVPTPVFLIATDGPAGRAGLTASAVAPVSAEASLMVACINKRSSSLNAIRRNQRFSISLLSRGQADLAARFAGMTGQKSEDRFAVGTWGVFSSGCPFLVQSVFSLDCRLIKLASEASHEMVFGEVEDIRDSDPTSDALIYYRRAFCMS